MNNEFESYHLSQNCREADQLPLSDIARYLNQTIPDFLTNKHLEVTQFSAGASNLTYRLFNGKQSLILRKPPAGTKAKSAHDMVREFNVLKTVGKFYSLSPNPICLCEDESVIGDRFFIMEEIKGLGIDKNLPVKMTEQQQAKLCENFVDGLVALHEIDITVPTMAVLGKPEGYVERQLNGWQGRFKKAKTDDVSSSKNIFEWLKINLPLDSGYQSLVHNDYKFDNLILDENEPEKIIGVLDWEMTTLGDPLLDLGCSLAYWVEADDNDSMQAIRMMPTHLKGMFSRQVIFERYCKKRNIQDTSLSPYYVFGLFRLAVIAQQIYFRFYHGQTDNQKFKNFGQLVNILLKQAEMAMKQ